MSPTLTIKELEINFSGDVIVEGDSVYPVGEGEVIHNIEEWLKTIPTEDTMSFSVFADGEGSLFVMEDGHLEKVSLYVQDNGDKPVQIKSL